MQRIKTVDSSKLTAAKLLIYLVIKLTLNKRNFVKKIRSYSKSLKLQQNIRRVYDKFTKQGGFKEAAHAVKKSELFRIWSKKLTHTRLQCAGKINTFILEKDKSNWQIHFPHPVEVTGSRYFGDISKICVSPVPVSQDFREIGTVQTVSKLTIFVNLSISKLHSSLH